MNALIKNSIIVATGSIASLILLIWLINPVMKDVGSLNQSLNAKKLELAHLDQQIRAYQTAESDLEHAADKQSVIGAILQKEDLETAIMSIEAKATATGVEEKMVIKDPFLEVKSTDKTAQKAKPTIAGLTDITEVSYELNTLSTYSGLIDFLSYLEHLPNFTEVTKLELSAESSSLSQNQKVASHSGRVIGNINSMFFVQNATTKAK